MRGTAAQVLHNASSLVAIAAALRVHEFKHGALDKPLACVFAALHLAVHNASIFTLTIDVMHLRQVRCLLSFIQCKLIPN